MDCSPPGSSVHGISQARILEWIVIFFSRGSSQARDRTCTSCTGRWILYHWATREVLAWSSIYKIQNEHSFVFTLNCLIQPFLPHLKPLTSWISLFTLTSPASPSTGPEGPKMVVRWRKNNFGVWERMMGHTWPCWVWEACEPFRGMCPGASGCTGWGERSQGLEVQL